jgi:hypothetical protein
MAVEAAGGRAAASDGLGSTSRAGLTPTNRFEKFYLMPPKTGKKTKLGELRRTTPFHAGILGSRALIVHDIRPADTHRTGGDAGTCAGL